MHLRQTVLYVALFILGASLCFLFATLLIQSWYIVDVHTREIRFSVVQGEHVGFDLNNSALIFGKVPQGGIGKRSTTLVSAVPSVAHISIEPTSLQEWLTVDRNDFYVNESGTQVLFTLFVPENAPPGNYTGVVTVYFTRRMPWD